MYDERAYMVMGCGIMVAIFCLGIGMGILCAGLLYLVGR